MKYICIILLLIPFVGNSQNYLEWIVPTEKGEIEYLLFTNEGYENLLKPLEVNNAGELISEILTQRKIILDLEKRVSKLEKEKTQRQQSELTVYEAVAMRLYFEYGQGMAKSRNIVNSAKKEGLTEYQEVLQFSINKLGLNKRK